MFLVSRSNVQGAKFFFTEFEFMNILNQFLLCKIMLHRIATIFFHKMLRKIIS